MCQLREYARRHSESRRTFRSRWAACDPAGREPGDPRPATGPALCHRAGGGLARAVRDRQDAAVPHPRRASTRRTPAASLLATKAIPVQRGHGRRGGAELSSFRASDRARATWNWRRRSAGLSRQDAAAKAYSLPAAFRSGGARQPVSGQLSGGQRQRVAIAQQFMCSEHFLLMDEPFSGLDLIAVDKVSKMIREVANSDELNTVIVVTHDISGGRGGRHFLAVGARPRRERQDHFRGEGEGDVQPGGTRPGVARGNRRHAGVHGPGPRDPRGVPLSLNSLRYFRWAADAEEIAIE